MTINGLTAPYGTSISAVIDGVRRGNTTVTSGGKYTMQVSEGSGTDIVFLIDTLTALETATWQQGGKNVLHLTAGFVPTPPTSTPLITPSHTHIFVGTANVNGGTTITAVINGVEQGSTICEN